MIIYKSFYFFRKIYKWGLQRVEIRIVNWLTGGNGTTFYRMWFVGTLGLILIIRW